MSPENLEFLKLLIEREAKQRSEEAAWHNLFLYINGALLAAAIALRGQKGETSSLICGIALLGLLNIAVWYQAAARMKVYHFDRQQDLARFITKNKVEDIFKAESEVTSNPKVLPHFRKVAVSHVIGGIAAFFAFAWLLLFVVLLFAVLRH